MATPISVTSGSTSDPKPDKNETSSEVSVAKVEITYGLPATGEAGNSLTERSSWVYVLGQDLHPHGDPHPDDRDRCEKESEDEQMGWRVWTAAKHIVHVVWSDTCDNQEIVIHREAYPSASCQAYPHEECLASTTRWRRQSGYCITWWW